MATMKYNTPPSGDHHDRQASVVGHGDGIALVNSVWGEMVKGGAQVNTLGNDVELASRYSTAPYAGETEDGTPIPRTNPYGYRDSSRQKRCIGKNDTCMGWAGVDDLCGFHRINLKKG